MNKNQIELRSVLENEGIHFNRNNKACCPFHKEKTPSFSIKNNKFKCFGCGVGGDAIDFIQEYKSMDYVEACNYLNIELDETRRNIETEKEKVKNKALSYYKNHSIRSLYSFTDEEGKTLYYKVKLIDKEGKKITPYYSIVNGKVEAKRNHSEVPYNLSEVIKAINDNKDIFIVEGEKDADTLKYWGYKATSLKGITDFNFSLFQGAKVYFIGDTGEGGEHYQQKVYKDIFHYVNSYSVVKLPGIELLGDNKDLSDWLEAEHTKEEFKRAVYKSLDLKNKYELQQNFLGIHKTTFKKRGEEVEEITTYITNFNVISAKNIRFVDEEREGIEIILKSQEGETFVKIGDVTVFNDVKSFKNFLGTMALTFSGKMAELDELKNWVYRYFTDEIQYIYSGIQFKDNKLITPNGAIGKEKVYKDTFCKSNNTEFNLNDELLSKEEARELAFHLFKFNDIKFTIPILGSIVNNMAYEKAIDKDIKLHHLLIIGESGSGKSTTKKAVINPILGYSNQYEGLAMGNITKFALTKALSEGNYTKVFDEYKPSKMNSNLLNVVSDLLRNSYDRMTVERGNKDQTVTEYKLKCPLVLCGEEGFQDEEKALIERSLTIYLSKAERPLESKEHLDWLQNNKEILYKLGNTLLNKILSLSNEEYSDIRSKYEEIDDRELKDRPLNTFLNTCTGFHILKDVLEHIGRINIKYDYPTIIKDIIKENVLQGEEEANADYETMLLKINDMVENKPYLREDKETYKIIIDKDKTYIKLNLILDDLSEYVRTKGLNISLVSNNDFIKRCVKAKYIIPGSKSNQTKKRIDGKLVSCYLFDTNKLFSLGCTELIGRGIVEKKEREHLKVVEQSEEAIPF